VTVVANAFCLTTKDPSQLEGFGRQTESLVRVERWPQGEEMDAEAEAIGVGVGALHTPASA